MKNSFRGKTQIQLEAELEQALGLNGVEAIATINRKLEKIEVCVHKKDELDAIRIIARKHGDFKHVETTDDKVTGYPNCFIEFR